MPISSLEIVLIGRKWTAKRTVPGAPGAERKDINDRLQ